jgi:RNA recognition motif-containing protein
LEDLRDAFPEINLVNFKMITRGKGKSGFGYAELASEVDVQQALKFDRRLLNGRPVFISPCEREKSHRSHGFKYSTKIEPNKLFVKGISYDATKEDLDELFKPFGEIKDLRLVINK